MSIKTPSSQRTAPEHRLIVWLLPGLLAAPAIHGQAPQSAGQAATEDMAALVQGFGTDRAGVSRFYDLPWSELRFDRLEKLYQEWRERLAGVSFDTLDQQGRIDYLLLRTEIESERGRVALQRTRLAEMQELLAFRESIQALESARWRLAPVNPLKTAAHLTTLAEQIKKLRERIDAGRKEKKEKDKSEAKPEEKKGPVPLKVAPVVARRAAEAASEIRGTLGGWFNFYNGYQPDFSWWVKKPFEEANKALEDYAKFLREEVAGLKGKDDDPLIGDPVGRDALVRALAGEMIPYTPEELMAIGESERAWCEVQMKKVSAEMSLGDDWKQALDRVKTEYVPPGSQDELIADYAREAIRYVREHDLVTIPGLCEETWRLTMLSPEAQKAMPYAAYGGQAMLVAYARDDMKHEEKLMSMRGNNRHFTRIVTAHELIPGHHLQAFVGARHRPYRSLFSTPFFVEGWPLYWEMKLWDLKYARSPEDRLGMLFWRMHRSARIIVSLKFHLGQMKPAEMIDFLVDRVGHERFGATSEVRRFIGEGYSPLYQCAYMIGGLQLRALHEETVASGKMTERQFNDTVLSCGAIPIEMVRAGLLELPLTRDSRAEWKFAGEVAGKK